MSKIVGFFLAPLLLSINIHAQAPKIEKNLEHSTCEAFVFSNNTLTSDLIKILGEKNYKVHLVSKIDDIQPGSLYIEAEHTKHRIRPNTTVLRIYNSGLNKTNHISLDNISSVKIKRNGDINKILTNLVPTCTMSDALEMNNKDTIIPKDKEEEECDKGFVICDNELNKNEEEEEEEEE